MASSQQFDNSEYTKKWRTKAYNFRNKSDCKYTDIVLIPRDKSDRFYCHRVILASASTYFENLFDNETDDKIYLTEDGLSGNILKILIEYMYKADIRINLENVIPLNHYSYEYGLQELHQQTNTFMEKSITSDTCLKFWRHGVNRHNDTLVDKCFVFIKANLGVFLERSINDLNDTEMAAICENLKNLNFDSLILSNIKTWVKNEFGIRKFRLEGLLKNINLDELTDNDIKELEDDPDLQYETSISKFISKYYKNKSSLK